MDEDLDQGVCNVPFRFGRAGSGNYDNDGENERLEFRIALDMLDNITKKKKLNSTQH